MLTEAFVRDWTPVDEAQVPNGHVKYGHTEDAPPTHGQAK